MFKNKRYVGLLFLILVSGIILLVVSRFVFEPELFKQAFSFLTGVFSFLIWAIAIAYFLNPIMMWLENHIKVKKGKRALSMLIVYIIFSGIVAFFAGLVIPLVVRNLIYLFENADEYLNEADKRLQELLNIPILYQSGAADVVNGWLANINSTIIENVDVWAMNAAKSAVAFGRGFVQFIFGTVLSIYILRDRERMLGGMRRLNFAVFETGKARRIAKGASRVNKIFKNYILGKIFDSIIIGIISYIVLAIIGAPLVLLQAVIMFITNMIPTLGPLIGAVPCLLLTLLVDPLKAIWVLIYIIVIQQIDGLILAPKILGDSLGLSPFYIIVGVLIGGGLFGIWGMFLGVPVFAAIKAFLDEYVDKRLDNKGVKI